jgi:hypothetical protein
MKKILVLFFVLSVFSDVSGQSLEEIKPLLKQKSYELDSSYQEYISANSWQLIYRYERTHFKRTWKAINYPNSFFIKGDMIYYQFPKKPSSNDSAEVYFSDFSLIVKYNEDEITFYDIINFNNDQYMVLEVARPKGWKGSMFKTPKIRLLYKKQE